MIEHGLLAHNVSKSYGPTLALCEANLAVAPGEIVAVTGASGSGKSTLLHCLAGIIHPDSGEIYFDGKRIDNDSETARSWLRRTRFGILFQFGQLIPELTGVENVALPLLLDGTKRRAARAAALEWLHRFGVGNLAEARPGEMSGGEGQRVALARALVTGPAVLFADEPTGALDSLASETVMTALVGAARQSDMSLIVVTHSARTAAYADREIVVRDGVLDPLEVVA